MSNFEFNKIDLTDLIVVIALSIALLVSITYGTNELSMSIASGLLGYIGGSTKQSKLLTNTQNSSQPNTTISNIQRTLDVAQEATGLLQSLQEIDKKVKNSKNKEE